MATLVMALLIVLLSIGGLCLGLFLGRGPIRGSCGGLACVKGARCGACGRSGGGTRQ